MIGPAIASEAHVIAFCADINKAQAPIEIPCSPLYGKQVNDCFQIVSEHISERGGSQAIGWAIWERPGVFIEAEFHTVWCSPEGHLICITPRQWPFNSITFLPDPSRSYQGRQVDNIRKPLVKDNDVVRFLFLAKQKYQIMNAGKLADMHGEIALPEKVKAEYIKVLKEFSRLEKRLGKRYGN